MLQSTGRLQRLPLLRPYWRKFESSCFAHRIASSSEMTMGPDGIAVAGAVGVPGVDRLVVTPFTRPSDTHRGIPVKGVSAWLEICENRRNPNTITLRNTMVVELQGCVQDYFFKFRDSLGLAHRTLERAFDWPGMTAGVNVPTNSAFLFGLSENGILISVSIPFSRLCVSTRNKTLSPFFSRSSGFRSSAVMCAGSFPKLLPGSDPASFPETNTRCRPESDKRLTPLESVLLEHAMEPWLCGSQSKLLTLMPAATVTVLEMTYVPI